MSTRACGVPTPCGGRSKSTGRASGRCWRDRGTSSRPGNEGDDMRQITVHLGTRTYPVLVGAGLLADAGRQCARLGLGRKVAVVTQTAIAHHARAVAE